MEKYFRLTPLALFLIISSNTASALEHLGDPAKLAPIGHYGLEVPSKQALKNIMPSGWHVYVHKQLQLPETLSWKDNDDMLMALSRIETDHGVIATVDWEKKAVYLRKKEVSVIKAPVAAPQPVTQQPAALAVGVSPVNGIVAKPVDYVPHVKTPADSVELGKPWAKNGPQKPAVVLEYAVSPGYAKKILEDAMAKVGYEVQWDAPPMTRTDHALTLFQNAETDTKLILDALGGTVSGLTAFVSHDAKQVKVVMADHKADSGKVFKMGGYLFEGAPTSPVVAVNTPAPQVTAPIVPSTTAAAIQPVATPVAPLANVPASAPIAATSTPAAPMAQAPVTEVQPLAQAVDLTKPVMTANNEFVLEVQGGTRFEDALEDFLTKHNYRLKWRAPSGLEAESTMTFKGATLDEVLNKVLPRLRLGADIFDDNEYSFVVVQPLDEIVN